MSNEKVHGKSTRSNSVDADKMPTTKKRGWDAIASIFDEKKEKKQVNLSSKEEDERKEKEGLSQKKRKSAAFIHEKGEWVDDGLGGKYNGEGFTGRIEDGVKIFKAHVLRKKNAGQTDRCPFDCDCCYI
jgi:Eukaryotic protein of unknown function (DUF1764)